MDLPSSRSSSEGYHADAPLRTQITGICFCFVILPGAATCHADGANLPCCRTGPLHPRFNKRHRFDFIPLLQKHAQFGLVAEEIVSAGWKKVRNNCVSHTAKLRALSAFSGSSLLRSAKCWQLSLYPAKSFTAAALPRAFETERWRIKLIHDNNNPCSLCLHS